MQQLELVGHDEDTHVKHFNCKGGAPWADKPLDIGDLGSGVLDTDNNGDDIAYCYSCGLDYPEEVFQSFEHVDIKVDPPVWQFDGVEWRMTA